MTQPTIEVRIDEAKLGAFMGKVVTDLGAPDTLPTWSKTGFRHLIVEPMAGNAIEENLNPVGRVYSGASMLCCTPNALAYGGHALGTIATDAALGEMVLAGGFKRFRRATESAFNRVFEATK